MGMMKEALLEQREFENKELESSLDICIGCGGLATRTNNTLCQSCWNDAECFEE